MAPVTGVAITGAASLPRERLEQVLQITERTQLDRLPDDDPACLQDLLQLITVAWSDPHRISDQAWRELRAPFLPLLPFLARPRAGRDTGGPRRRAGGELR